MGQRFGRGGGAQPLGSASQQLALLGLHWGLLLLNYRGPPFRLIPEQEAATSDLPRATDV